MQANQNFEKIVKRSERDDFREDRKRDKRGSKENRRRQRKTKDRSRWND